MQSKVCQARVARHLTLQAMPTKNVVWNGMPQIRFIDGKLMLLAHKGPLKKTKENKE